MIKMLTFSLFVIGLPFTTGARGQALGDLSLPDAPAEPWRFEKFPIVAWWAPPGTATLDDFRRYAEAGFTLHATNPDSGYEQSMRFLDQVGLKSLAFREAQGFGLPAAKNVDYDAHGGTIVGWITRDEPGADTQVVEAITAVNELMRRDPDRRALFNFLPPHAQPEMPTRQIIDVAVRNGLPILSFDHYYIFADGSDDEQTQCAHLDLFRKASLEHDVPFWAFALSIRHFNYRRPSESDLRWMQYTNLAYGAKGLWYFTYWGPDDWENWDQRAIVDPADGAPTRLYDYVKTLNHAVLEMGDVLLGLTNQDVFHTDPPEGQRQFPAGEFWISHVKARDAIVSFFEDDEGVRYAMIVNKQHGMDRSAAELTDEIAVTFADDVREVTAVSWLDGEAGPVALENGRAVLPVAGGTGVLLRAR